MHHQTELCQRGALDRRRRRCPVEQVAKVLRRSGAVRAVRRVEFDREQGIGGESDRDAAKVDERSRQCGSADEQQHGAGDLRADQDAGCPARAGHDRARLAGERRRDVAAQQPKDRRGDGEQRRDQ